MGERVLFIVKNKQGEYGPCAVYGHWSGDKAHQIIAALRERMGDRTDDVSYATARLFGVMHERIPGNLSLGAYPLPDDFEAATLEAYSHGDGGVLVINCHDWSVQAYGGYWGENGAAMTKPDWIDA